MKKIFFALLLCICFASPALGEEKATMTPGNVPTKIDADVMDYNADKNTVVFKGSVHVVREEFQLWADTITIYLAAADQTNTDQNQLASLQTGDIEKIVATDNVSMKYNTQTGTCGKATYTADQALLVMEINPILKDGVNSITGEVIRYYMNENRSEVVGGKKRVEALFSTSTPDELKKSLNN